MNVVIFAIIQQRKTNLARQEAVLQSDHKLGIRVLWLVGAEGNIANKATSGKASTKHLQLRTSRKTKDFKWLKSDLKEISHRSFVLIRSFSKSKPKVSPKSAPAKQNERLEVGSSTCAGNDNGSQIPRYTNSLGTNIECCAITRSWQITSRRFRNRL